MNNKKDKGGRFSATYTNAQIEYIKEYYPKLDCPTFTQKFNKRFKTNKKETALKTYANKILKLKKNKGVTKHLSGRKYTPEQNEWLIKNYNKYTLKDLVSVFNETFNTNVVNLQAHCYCELGLTRKKQGYLKRGYYKDYAKEMVDWCFKNYDKFENNVEMHKAFTKKFNVKITFCNFRYLIDTRLGYLRDNNGAWNKDKKILGLYKEFKKINNQLRSVINNGKRI